MCLAVVSINDHLSEKGELIMNRAIFILAILALSAAVAILGCDRSNEPKKPQADAASVAPGAGSPSSANAKLEKAVKARFESDEQLKSANLSVVADVTKNEVTLSGTVDSEAMRAKAVELAKGAQVGVVVTDRISVKQRKSNTVPLPEKAFLI
jgi:osmotically-inducible protein OsmY